MARHKPLNLRLKLKDTVIKLYMEGLSYRNIQRRIKMLYGVELPRSTISYWVRNLHTPEGKVKRLDKSDMDAYAFIMGASIGDAYLKKRPGKKGDKHIIIMRVRDRDFLEEYIKNISKVIPGIKPRIKIGRRGFYTTTIYNKLLYLDIKKYIENPEKICQDLKNHKQAFLKGIYDAEGFVTVSTGVSFSGAIGLVNSDADLCSIISRFLSDLNIKHRMYSIDRRGEKIRIGRWVGRINKIVYVILISSFMSVCRFSDLIGFRIHRKQDKLNDFIDITTTYGKSDLAIEKWREKYSKIKNRWVKKKDL